MYRVFQKHGPNFKVFRFQKSNRVHLFQTLYTYIKMFEKVLAHCEKTYPDFCIPTGAENSCLCNLKLGGTFVIMVKKVNYIIFS